MVVVNLTFHRELLTAEKGSQKLRSQKKTKKTGDLKHLIPSSKNTKVTAFEKIESLIVVLLIQPRGL